MTPTDARNRTSRPARTSTASGPTSPSWLVVALPAAGLVALAALFAAGAFSGAFTAFANFTDPGAVVRWGAPVATVLTELSLAVTVGALALAACVLPRGPLVDRALGVAGVAAGVWTLAALVQLVLRFSWSFYVPLDSPTFGTALMEYVSNLEIGRTYLGIVIVAALTAAIALLVRGPVGALCTLALPLVALGMQSSTGHAAGAASHDVAISALFLHLGGAALWIGGLGAIALVGLRHAVTADVIRRYSEIAFWCFLAVAVSGLVSAWIRIGSLDGLSTDYGTLLVVKAALLIVLGSLGYLHRSTVVARLSAGTTTRNAAIGLFWRLAAVEVGVMGAVSGVAVALGSTAPPVPDDEIVDPTPAEIVTGHPLPPEPTALRWLTEFQWDVILAFACAAALFVYVRWALRLRRRGDAWPVGRTISWCLGILVLFWATNGGAAAYGHVLFSAHMVQHMILAMVVPLFLVLAAPVTLLVRAVPARKDGSRGPREWVLVLVHSAVGRFLANPVVAAVLFAGGMIVFYFTPLFELALTTYAGHLWMVAHFTLVGYLFANALIGVDPGPSRPGYPLRLVLLFATMAFHAFFGVTLTSGTALLVPDWFGLMGRPWGPSAIEDQQKGGAVAWGIGELPTLLLAVGVAISWARSDAREAKRNDRKAERDGDAELEAYNKMLAEKADQAAKRGDP
ncbi:cytochrome c oxidase assembly protein [Promicromonospora panici]|uniref:cytochrome c oxidase assembly protein n=1 Tax=Promicromonospora panici TaxID=2219658 RepID=UPI00101C9C25|nr:cytochrome c oxidase assembly protein [Promicromonospora panici]